MKMKILDFVQGSAEWHAHRATARNASEAPMVMGDSNYGTRDDLMRRMVSGVAPEVTPWQQKIFDRGHAVEPALREYAEAIIGEDLSPVCATSDDGYLSCSFDGVTFMGDTIAEFKQTNQGKLEDIDAGRLPLTDKWQVVQGFAVNTDAQACIYVCGDGTPEGTRHLIVNRVDHEADIERLRAGWEQFDKDRATYVVQPKRAQSMGATPETLPALRIEVVGKVAASNLEEWREAAMARIDGINRNLQTDQDFADAASMVQFLKDAEKALKGELDRALNSAEDIERLRRVGGDVLKHMAEVRLELDKLVKAEKENRKGDLIAAQVNDLQQHVKTLNAGLGEYAFPVRTEWPGILGQQLHGMRSLDAMEAKLSEYVANQKVAYSMRAEEVRQNAALLTELDPKYAGLFPDRVALAQDNEPARLRDTVDARVARFDLQERERLEAERARIRAEEERRAQAEALAKVHAEAEAERQRLAAEALAKAKAEADLAEAAAAPAPQSDQQAPASAPSEAAPAAPVKCDGNHGGPRCADPERWNDDASNEPTLNVSAINKRLAPLSISAAGLAEFGIEPLANEKNARLYSEAQFEVLLRKLVHRLASQVDHIMTRKKEAAEQLEAA